MKEDILGYSVTVEKLHDCIDGIFDALFQPMKKTWLACLNPHSYVVALDDAQFSRSLHGADWLIPDGVGVVCASRWLGGQIGERMTGSDVFSGLHRRMNERGGMSVFFLGATEDTLALIKMRMARDYPEINVVGTYSPPFRPLYTEAEVDEMVCVINKVKPDVLWVGMTAPKQEKWIANNLHRLDVRFAGAVGAVFDFYTGKVKRSHPMFQRIGLEWLPRLVQQPKRLWRRMLVSAPIFLLHVVRAKLHSLKA